MEFLARLARKETRDARVTDDEVEGRIASSPVLIGRPDGGVAHLSHALEGSVLTQRVRSSTARRNDLWTTLALMPYFLLAVDNPLPLASGGELRAAAFGHAALVGPDGWLPEVAPWELVALALRDGKIHTCAVQESDLGDLARHQRVRELIARHYRRERWFTGSDDPENRPAEVVNAIALALLEEPALLAKPLPPLDELLHDALKDQHHFHWRDFAAHRQGDTVSFSISGMPEALHVELSRRAHRYGMSFDQYVIAVLGHLAWRTPFAENMEPCEHWSPDQPKLTAGKRDRSAP